MMPIVLLLFAAAPEISAATKDDSGILTHQVRSEYQLGVTKIRVLLPEKIDANAKLPVIYVLPVEANDENLFGDGLTVKCGEDAVSIAMVQPAGKGRMAPGELARGRGIEVGELLA